MVAPGVVLHKWKFIEKVKKAKVKAVSSIKISYVSCTCVWLGYSSLYVPTTDSSICFELPELHW